MRANVKKIEKPKCNNSLVIANHITRNNNILSGVFACAKTTVKYHKIMNILAIDPGNEYTAYCVIDAKTYKPWGFAKLPNKTFMEKLEQSILHQLGGAVVCEMIASYGMGVGQSVFETCVFIGEIKHATQSFGRNVPFSFMYRKDVKMNLCNSMRAKDGNIIQSLVDRFAPNTPNKGKGTKADKGWFYGFKADIWQAYAVGVSYIDKIKEDN